MSSTPSTQQRFVLVIAILASFVAFLDSSVINVALPAMSKELGGGLATQQWVVDAYLITLGSLILLAGSLSDLFGRKRILMAGLIGFGVTSVLIAVAPTAAFVIVLRGLQGVAGALLVPSSLAIIMSTFRDQAQARAIGTWTAWTSAAFLLGPILGGIFVDTLSWRLVFAINVIPIALTIVMLARLHGLDARAVNAKVDVVGGILGILGLGGPVYALIESQNFGWTHPLILIPLIGGVLSFAGFLWWETRAKHPMLPLGIFQNRNFSAGNIATVFIYGALSLGGLIVTVFLQQVANFPATLAALAFLPVSIANVLLSRVFGGLAGRYGPRFFMTAGPIIGGIGYLLMLRIGEQVNYWTDVLPGVLLFAVGLSMTVAPLTSAILGSIPAAQSGIGSAVNNAVARVAGLISIALLGLMLAGPLMVANFHRVVVITALMLIVGGIVSFIGIRNPKREPSGQEAAAAQGK